MPRYYADTPPFNNRFLLPGTFEFPDFPDFQTCTIMVSNAKDSSQLTKEECQQWQPSSSSRDRFPLMKIFLGLRKQSCI